MDFKLGKQLCDDLNRTGFQAEGRLSSLSAGVLKDGKLQTLRNFALAA